MRWSLDRPGEGVASRRAGRFAQQRGVVPGLAGDAAAPAVGALLDDVGEHGAHVARQPAGAERHVAGVQPEIAHDSRTRR